MQLNLQLMKKIENSSICMQPGKFIFTLTTYTSYGYLLLGTRQIIGKSTVESINTSQDSLKMLLDAL